MDKSRLDESAPGGNDVAPTPPSIPQASKLALSLDESYARLGKMCIDRGIVAIRYEQDTIKRSLSS